MNKYEKLDPSDLKAIEKKLLMVQRVDHAIQYRKYELEIKDRDMNVGGSRPTRIANPTENLIMKWDSDSKLQSLYEFKKRIEELKNWFNDDEDLQLVFHYCFESDKHYTIDEIAEKIYMNDRTVRRKKRKILEKYHEITDGFW